MPSLKQMRRGALPALLYIVSQEYPGTGNRIEAAPECVSVVFDEKSGLCTKMTGGFCIDRGVGNTGPAGGIWGVMQVNIILHV